MMGSDEIFVIHHTDCGFSHFSNEELRGMLERYPSVSFAFRAHQSLKGISPLVRSMILGTGNTQKARVETAGWRPSIWTSSLSRM